MYFAIWFFSAEMGGGLAKHSKHPGDEPTQDPTDAAPVKPRPQRWQRKRVWITMKRTSALTVGTIVYALGVVVVLCSAARNLMSMLDCFRGGAERIGTMLAGYAVGFLMICVGVGLANHGQRNREHGADRPKLMYLAVVLTVSAAAILWGYIGPGPSRSPKIQTRTEIKALGLAIKQYEATYGFLPFNADDALCKRGLGVESPITLDDGLYCNLIKTLQGDRTLNPRGLKWNEVQKNEDGEFEAGVYTDGWGNNFWIALDLDYDGDIEPSGKSGPFERVHGTMAIWSLE